MPISKEIGLPGAEHRDILWSLVIPTFNRAALVDAAVNSALRWLQDRADGEIIVVDDCSTDNTLEQLRQSYVVEIASARVRLLALSRNVGVTGAKNAGVQVAIGRYIVFLDSDDEMVAESRDAIGAAIDAYPSAPAIFFRCEDYDSGEFVGRSQTSVVVVDLHRYFNAWYGECLPFISRTAAIAHPYQVNLHGFEGLAYARMIRDLGPIIVSPTIARRYRTSGADRLSSRKAIQSRAAYLMRGHWIFLKEFGAAFGLRGVAKQIAKVIYYAVRAGLHSARSFAQK